MAQVILLDIEGTTSAIDFVHRTLFPYARERIGEFVRERTGEAAVADALADVRATLAAEGEPDADLDACIVALERWIDEDRKHGALKALQGMIWRAGFESGAFTAHVYDDVPPALERWRHAGKRLAIYSSGSVEAQRLFFRHSVAGDLTPLLDAHYDTRIGPKREVESYRAIARDLAIDPGEVLFLSDVAAELDAALAAGLAICQVVRPGTEPAAPLPRVRSFADVEA